MKRNVLIIYVIFSLIYIFAGDTLAQSHGNTVAAVLKVIPIALLIFVSLAITPNRWLPIALFFGACGDTLLALLQFVPGLSAFLVGHIFYILMWSGQFDIRKGLNAIPVALFAIAISIYLLPFLGDMAIPVILYIGVISLMAASASVSKLVNVWGIFGVYSFLISDLLIAWNRFVEPIPVSGLLIMGSYYFAQSAICYNIISKSNRHEPSY